MRPRRCLQHGWLSHPLRCQLDAGAFSRNETYFLTDKRALAAIAGFAVQPVHFGERLNAILAHPGCDAAALSASVARLHALWRETCALSTAYYTGSAW